MSTSRNANPASSSTTLPSTERSYFEQQREILLKEIGISFEHVLSNISLLNRNLEAVITVGNEFAGVEALWSQFENVMGTERAGGKKEGEEKEGAEGETVLSEDFTEDLIEGEVGERRR